MSRIVRKYFHLSNEITLILILVVATALRFYNFTEIPFTHDEFSALFRTYFSDFGDLIAYGVKVDGHPAGVQVFLYYWTKCFGEAEWVVKLPFMISGILAVFMIYKIGKLWYNETVGLISAAFLASLQYSVMYSQIARPYGSGIFLILAMVWFWSLIVKNEGNLIRNLILYVIFASLSTYNHYFSFLFAVIVAITGFFVIEKKLLLKYLIANICIAVLYIPHINIFIAHLRMGGVEGWLSKPDSSFFGNYLAYIFHFSYFSLGLIIALIVLGIALYEKKTFSFKKLIIFLTWFLLPMLIGYFYSVYGNAVLQYSVLIFSFPFLFFIFFGHLKNMNKYTNLIIVFCILSVNIITLIYGRNHYEIFYESSYKKIITDYVEFKDLHPDSPGIIESNQKITNYYLKHLNIDKDFIFIDKESSRSELVKLISGLTKNNDYLYLGCTSHIDPITVPLIMDSFSKIEMKNNYFAGTTYLFSKNGNMQLDIITEIDFSDIKAPNWDGIDANHIITDNQNNSLYSIKDYMEWSPSYSINFDELNISKYDFIDISLKAVSEESFNDVFLIASFDSNEKNIYYTASDFADFKATKTENNHTNIHLSLKLSDINLNYDNIIIKIYVWNKGKKYFQIDDFKIAIRAGNPIVYSLTNSI
ncbi:MAG: glycosyltransferase family 39 protein [Bacteroidales bacterium]|nr:glycosyltransferase family 39 protein [Bacteroidales bacterium]